MHFLVGEGPDSIDQFFNFNAVEFSSSTMAVVFAHLANYSCYHQTRSAGLGILGPFFRLLIRKKLLSRRFSKLLIFNTSIEPLRPTQMTSLNIEAPINSNTVPSLKVSVFFTADPQIETSDYFKKRIKNWKIVLVQSLAWIKIVQVSSTMLRFLLLFWPSSISRDL